MRLDLEPDRRKVDMHGGGKRYGRRIEVLTKQNASKQFLERLQCGRLKEQAITSCSSKPVEITPLPVTKIAEISLSSNHPTSPKRASTVRIRICGRIISVVPSKPEDIFQHLLLREDCECGALSNPSVLPSFVILLEDVSGQLPIVVTTSAIRTLLGSKFDDFFSSLKALLNEEDESGRFSKAVKTLDSWSTCVGGWIDAVLTIQRNNGANVPTLVYFGG
ncbi:unnamed protein product [Hymenolepis diminuta]|uniref:Tudor domain-containing protein n=1 Tax=Hymenolepis diminuta TaxID=6216 RepID=A0A0R3SGI3_HYMDI|nr:unnamed protein product [Hymenolepis diminuta]